MARPLTGALVKGVDPGSIAQRAGIVAQDRILAVDGHLLSDVFDWLWHSDSNQIELTLVRDDIEQRIELDRSKNDDEDWGIEFDDMLFDGTRTCANACAFCFMDQLPEGLRESLYLKDDDYRLSFFEGNFITLTNINDDDVARIIEQHLSPLYVSMHAIDPQVRKRLIGSAGDRGLEVFQKLVAGGIEMHVSIVLVPGINDGAVLDETLEFLEWYRPSVKSVGIVAVAYTQYTEDIAGETPRSFDDQLLSAHVIEQVQSYQFRSRESTGQTWVYLADEFYIYAHAPMPTSEWYDDYPQYENGIGIVHTYVEDIRAHLDQLTDAIDELEEGSEILTIVTGELTTDTMLGTLSALHAGSKIRLLPIKNQFFGGNVKVTGLLTGIDIVSAINYDNQRLDVPTNYVIPWSIFNDDELTLDGYTPQMIADAVDAPVIFVADDAVGLLEAIKEVSP